MPRSHQTVHPHSTPMLYRPAIHSKAGHLTGRRTGLDISLWWAQYCIMAVPCSMYRQYVKVLVNYKDPVDMLDTCHSKYAQHITWHPYNIHTLHIFASSTPPPSPSSPPRCLRNKNPNQVIFTLIKSDEHLPCIFLFFIGEFKLIRKKLNLSHAVLHFSL